jgi:hypothetical protein
LVELKIMGSAARSVLVAVRRKVGSIPPLPLPGWPKLGAVRRLALGLGFVVAIATLALKLKKHNPVEQWFFWKYAGYWLCALGLVAATLSAGFLLVRLVCRRLPLVERLYLAVPAGVVVAFWCTFAAGRFALLGRAFGVILPLALIASGAWPLFQELRRALPRLRALRRRRPPLSTAELFAVALGFLCLVVVYLAILTPENAAYDARWYHLPLAEHYAASGAIERSPEGWFQAALPHLASCLYLWPFLFPLRLFDQVEIAAHFELVLFLWTLAGVPLLLRRLVPGIRVRAAWAVFFLFPALFVYDSGLSVAADHVAALFAIPIYLVLLRAWRALEVRSCALLGLLMAGAMLTKYQAVSLVAFPALAVAVRAAWLLGMDARRAARKQPTERRWLVGPLVAALTAIAVTSAHWLKNLMWYGDPMYPVLHRHLTVRPWNLDGAVNYRTQTEPELWRPKGPLFDQLKETAQALWTFSFEPHDWYHFHRDWPVFGSLFTLSLFVLPFVRAPRRVWALFVAGNVAIATWYLSTHQDRYLQILLPWLASFVAAVIALAWRSGAVGRIGIFLLAALQGIWGVGAVSIPSHPYTGTPVKAAIELFGSSFVRERFPKRFDAFTDWDKAGKSLPKNATVLVHHEDVHAGLRRRSITDSAMWQGRINYGRLASPRAVHAELRDLGVTHVLWIEGDTISRYSLASDLRFSALVVNGLADEKTFGGIHVARLPRKAPAEQRVERVLYLGCTGYTRGVYDLAKMVVPGRNPEPSVSYPKPDIVLDDTKPVAIERLLRRVDYAVVNATCQGAPGLPPSATRAFAKRYHRYGDELWVRRLPR